MEGEKMLDDGSMDKLENTIRFLRGMLLLNCS